jgi:hypothetical protein
MVSSLLRTIGPTSHTTYRVGKFFVKGLRIVVVPGVLAGGIAAIGAAATGGSTGPSRSHADLAF